MRYPIGFICLLALGVIPLVQCTGDGGTGGSGDGGTGGTAAGGTGGTAGAGGSPNTFCEPTSEHCSVAALDVHPHQPCCDQPVPEQANACDGTESTENPTTCTATGNTVTHRLTFMEVESDCNVGYDLDRCDGMSCVGSGLTPPEGTSGVDNALAGLAPVFVNLGRNLGILNKLLSDALCGMTDRPDGGDDDCLLQTIPLEIRLVIDANASESCANVTVLADGEASAHILNLSDDGCASGTLGTIALPILVVDGSLENTVVRMTVSAAGFSDGQLGATMDEYLATEILSYWLGPAGTITSSPLDMNASTSPTQDTPAECDGLSAMLRIGGIAE